MTNTKLGQRGDGRRSDKCILQHNTVVDVSDVFRGLNSLWTLGTEKVKDTNSKLGELAVLDEFAKVCKSFMYVSKALDPECW